MPSILITLLVSKLLRSREVSSGQSTNIKVIYFTLLVLKLLRSMEVSLEQS